MNVDLLQPHRERIRQYVLAGVVVILLVGAVSQIALVMAGSPLILSVLIAVVMLVLTLPTLMYMAATPPMTISAEGVTLHPLLLPEQQLRWEDVVALKPYPLLPTKDSEVVKRRLQGKQKYKPAEGVMLISARLPFPYKILGYFTGEGGKGVVALTNRTHESYPSAVRQLKSHVTFIEG